MKLYLSLIFSLVSFFGTSNSTDSLKQCINQTNSVSKKIVLNSEISNAFYRLGSVDSSLHYNIIAGKLAETNEGNYPYGVPKVFISRVLFYFQNQKFEAATKEVHKLLKHTSTFSSRNKRVLYEYYAMILTQEEKPKEAIHILQQALNIGKKEGVQLGLLYLKIGNVFYKISNYKKARYYYNLALNYSDAREVIIKNNIINTFTQEERIDDAYKLLGTILSETDSITHNNYRLFNTLGNLYMATDNYDKAIPILLSTNAFIKQHTKDIHSLMDNNMVLSNAYISKYQIAGKNSFLDQAKHHIEVGLTDAIEATFLQSQIDFYSTLTKVLIYQKDDEGSVKAFENYKSIRDSLYQLEINTIVEELDVKYETVEKQKEITSLLVKRTNKELVHQKARSKMVLIISISILTSLILLFFYYSSKVKKKRLLQSLHIESMEKRELESLLRLKENEINMNIGLISEKSKLIQELKDASNKTNSSIDDIIQKFEQSYITDKEWGTIQIQFDSIYQGLIDRARNEVEKLTQNDVKLLILLKLKYSNATMSEILNISYEGVKKAKQRLSKKIDLELLYA